MLIVFVAWNSYDDNKDEEDQSLSTIFWLNTTIYSLNVVVMAVAAVFIYKWKWAELKPLGYCWNFREDGLFLIFSVIQVVLVFLSVY